MERQRANLMMTMLAAALIMGEGVRDRGRRLGGHPRFDEQVRVTNGLHGQKDAIEDNGCCRKERCLRRCERLEFSRNREVRQDQGQHREGNDHREECLGALQIIVLLAMAERADKKRQADHPVQDDHQYREHGVTSHGRIIGAVQHDRGDQGYLDADHCQRQNQGTEGLAQNRREALGMADYAGCAPQHGAE